MSASCFLFYDLRLRGARVLSGVLEPAVWQRDAKNDACNFGESVGFGQFAEDMRN